MRKPIKNSQGWFIPLSCCQTTIILQHGHLHTMSFLCIKFHQNPSSSLGGIAQTRKSIKNSQSYIISLSSCRTTIILLHAHLHIMFYLCVKFHQNLSSGLGGVALTRKFIKNSQSWIISLSGCGTLIILLHAHLQIMSFLCIKFHQNPSSGLGVALTRKCGRTDRQTDRQTYPPNFVTIMQSPYRIVMKNSTKLNLDDMPICITLKFSFICISILSTFIKLEVNFIL